MRASERSGLKRGQLMFSSENLQSVDSSLFVVLRCNVYRRQAPSGWTMCAARAQRLPSQSVSPMAGGSTTAPTVRTWG